MVVSLPTTPWFQASRRTPLKGTVLLFAEAGLLAANDALIRFAINVHALGQVMLIRSVCSMLTVMVWLLLRALVGAVCIILSGIAIIRFRRTPG